MTAKKEIRSLTGIRGIAALYVALFHSMENKANLHPSVSDTFFGHGYLSVDLFFMLSGFVITLSSEKYFSSGVRFSSWLEFMKKRFARIYPMYFITLVIGFVFINHFQGALNFAIGLTMLSILFAPGWIFLHLWSLNAEWIAYICFPVLYKISFLKSSRVWLMGCVAVSLVVVFIYTYFNHYYTGNNPIDKGLTDVVKCFAEYILGIIAYSIVSGGVKVRNRNILQAVITVGILWLLFVSGSDAFVITLFFPLLIVISEDKGWLSTLMSSGFIYFLGLISYSLYLVHPVVLYILKSKLGYYPNADSGSVILFNTVYLSVVISLSFLSFRMIELPAQRWINGYFKKRTESIG